MATMKKPAGTRRGGLPNDRLGGMIDRDHTPLPHDRQAVRFDPDAAPHLSAYDGCRRIGFIVAATEETLAFDSDEILVTALPAGRWREAFRALCVADMIREGAR